MILKSYDLITGIITSDFQTKIRWGWMGFENEYWDFSKVENLLYPRHVVDVEHKRGNTIGGHILGLEFHICEDYERIQADWKIPKNMECVIATFLIEHNTKAKQFINNCVNKNNPKIGISIEHYGRKPKRVIGPYVTLTNRPWNTDAWMILGNINNKEYDNLYPKKIANSSYDVAKKQYEMSKSLLS